MQFNKYKVGSLYHLNQTKKAEQILTRQKWFAHDAAAGYIKLFWLHRFNKKRPAIVPNYVIPNEFESLFQLTKSSGLSVALDSTALPFLKAKSLEQCDISPIDFRPVSLLSSKKNAPEEITKKLVALIT